jgi:hypothetical protein
MTFGRGGGGAVDHLTYGGIHAPRVVVVTAASVALGAFVGAYYSPELDTTYRIAVRDGTLVAEHSRHGTVLLSPLLEDEFEGSEWFVPSLAFDRDDGGAITGFRISQGRSRNLRFERLTDSATRD